MKFIVYQSIGEMKCVFVLALSLLSKLIVESYMYSAYPCFIFLHSLTSSIYCIFLFFSIKFFNAELECLPNASGQKLLWTNHRQHTKWGGCLMY